MSCALCFHSDRSVGTSITSVTVFRWCVYFAFVLGASPKPRPSGLVPCLRIRPPCTSTLSLACCFRCLVPGVCMRLWGWAMSCFTTVCRGGMGAFTMCTNGSQLYRTSSCGCNAIYGVCSSISPEHRTLHVGGVGHNFHMRVLSVLASLRLMDGTSRRCTSFGYPTMSLGCHGVQWHWRSCMAFLSGRTDGGGILLPGAKLRDRLSGLLGLMPPKQDLSIGCSCMSDPM